MRGKSTIIRVMVTLVIAGIISVVVLQLFITASNRREKARDVSEACIVSESIANMIKGSDSIDQAVKELKLQQVQDNHSTAVYEAYYDSNWNQVKKKDSYRATVTMERQKMGHNTMYIANIVLKCEKNNTSARKEEGHVLSSLQIHTYK